jgi:ArsR family transcriptional regulator
MRDTGNLQNIDDGLCLPGGQLAIDPVRLRLMSLVASHPGGEACVCDLTGAFDLSQPTISHHLKVLHETGLMDREKRGVWVYYRARTSALASLAALIGSPAAENSAH